MEKIQPKCERDFCLFIASLAKNVNKKKKLYLLFSTRSVKSIPFYFFLLLIFINEFHIYFNTGKSMWFYVFYFLKYKLKKIYHSKKLRLFFIFTC